LRRMGWWRPRQVRSHARWRARNSGMPGGRRRRVEDALFANSARTPLRRGALVDIYALRALAPPFPGHHAPAPHNRSPLEPQAQIRYSSDANPAITSSRMPAFHSSRLARITSSDSLVPACR
jgi:hypothetical protein